MPNILDSWKSKFHIFDVIVILPCHCYLLAVLIFFNFNSEKNIIFLFYLWLLVYRCWLNITWLVRKKGNNGLSEFITFSGNIAVKTFGINNTLVFTTGTSSKFDGDLFHFLGISARFCCGESSWGYPGWGLIGHDSWDVLYEQLPVYLHKTIDISCMQSSLWVQLTLKPAFCGVTPTPWVGFCIVSI